MRCQSRNCRPSATSCFQCPTSYAFHQPHPAAHRTASYPENPGRLGLRKTLLNSLDDSPAKVFLGFSGQRASILFSHARNTSTLFRECHLYYAPISKSRASIAELWKNGRVETKCLPFAPGLLTICRQHVSAQQQSQKRRQGSSLLQHRRKPSQRFGQDGAANRSLSRRDQRSATSGMAQDVVGV